MKLLITLLFLFSQAVEASNFKSQAPKVADTLKKNLMGNLQKQIAEHGVLKALDFCHLNVKDLAQETAAQFKGAYEFGRVSHKVRNPNNSPKDWMEDYLNKFKDKKQGMNDTAPFFHTLNNGKQVYLEPLWVAPMCLQCHGENISKNVSNEILKRYPQDKARGFKPGDFRGFIWVKEK
ncbi:MAG TPA: DUF3365 domain-containing protein [Bacteriovoracaceae bacterium]|nr:DUF3365 domain-containing protein [Bacteriovoracaceae bacterium]